jgi:hypothetical protein
MSVSPVGAVGRESTSGFLGINLRRDSLSLADEDLLRAINADLHRTPGVIRLRQGRTLQPGAALPGAVRTLTRHGLRQYQVAGSGLFRDGTSILTGLSGATSTLTPYRPLNDTTTWSFLADQAAMRKDDGTIVRLWGIVAPTGGAGVTAGGAGGLTGTYSAYYTYARVVGTSIAHESNPSPAVAGVALTAQELNIAVVASEDPQVTRILVYRTVAGGTLGLFAAQLSNATQTYVSGQTDISLGTQVELDNNPPPLAGWVAEHQGHLFLCLDATNPHYLWYSKRFRPESWPLDQFLELGNPYDPLQCAVPLTGVLGVFSRETKYRVLGNAVSGFVGIEALSTRGVPAPNAVTVTSRGTLFVARDGIFLTNFVEADLEISQSIQALFYGETINELAPIAWNVPEALTMAEYKRRLYFGYQDTAGARMLAVYSLDTQHWYHYTHPVHRLYADESTDTLLMGDTTGNVWSLEQGTTDGGAAIALDVTLPVRDVGDRFRRKRFGWLGLDLESQEAPWQADVLLDGALHYTGAFFGARQRRYVRLPGPCSTQTWQVRLRCLGGTDAACYSVEILEDDPYPRQVWIADALQTDIFTQLVPGIPPVPFTLMRYEYLRFDAATGPGTWRLDVLIDDTLRYSLTFAGARNRQLRRLPDRLLGFAWRLVAQYSLSPAPLVYSAELLSTPLRAA